MPPERFAADDPREWISRARSSLRKARQTAPGIYLEDLCFDAQQAAEKAIKAVLLQRGISFPYIHDLGRLLELLAQAGESIPEDVREAAKLSDYAVLTRYPLPGVLVDRTAYEAAIRIADDVVHWAAGLISTPGG